MSVFCYPLADGEGNIWCENGETLDVQRQKRDALQIWAPPNRASPYLMRVTPGGQWTVIADMEKPFSPTGVATYASIDPAVLSLEIDQQGQMYAYGSRLDPRAQRGTSVVLRIAQ